MSRRWKANGQSGFTLFELLVVLCILAILCGVALTRLDVKKTTDSAWNVVKESAYLAAKGALAKALAEDPGNPPTLEELANRIDSKRTIYATQCSIAGSSLNPVPFNADYCLAIDIDGDGLSDPGEVFAAAYSDGDCQIGVNDINEEVCCLERPFWDTTMTNPLPYAGTAGQSL